MVKCLPQFKKLKSRLFQFGYKVFHSGDRYSGQEFVSILDRSMTRTLLSEVENRSVIKEPAKSIDVDELQRGVGVDDGERTEAQDVVQRVGVFAEFCEKNNVRKILVCSDGSANFFKNDLDDNYCADASAGVILIPLPSLLSPPTSYSLTALPEVEAETEVQAEAEAEAETAPTKRAATAAFSVAAAGKEQRASDEQISQQLLSASLPLRVSHLGGAVLTPFDAELAAGLTACTLCRLVVDKLVKEKTEEEEEEEKEEKGQGQGQGQEPVEIILCSDSRSLCRAVRMGPPSPDPSSPDDPSIEGAGAGAPQIPVSRLLMWQAMAGHIAHIDAQSKKQVLPLRMEWVLGHPERRGGGGDMQR